jgi:hypothetical protein
MGGEYSVLKIACSTLILDGVLGASVTIKNSDINKKMLDLN